MPPTYSVKIWDSTLGRSTRILAAASEDAAVDSLAASPDGKWLASGAKDGVVKVWEAATGHEARNFRADDGDVTCLVFSPDGKQLVTSSGDKSIKIWDVSGGQLVRTLDAGSTWVSGICLSPDGKELASAGRDSAIKIWNTQTGAEIRALKAADRTDVTFSPDGKWIAGVGSHAWAARSSSSGTPRVVRRSRRSRSISRFTMSTSARTESGSRHPAIPIRISASGIRPREDLKYTLGGHPRQRSGGFCFRQDQQPTCLGQL